MILRYRLIACLLTLLALLALAYVAYAPGLSGGFLFDDFVNLNAIGATGAVDNWPSFFRYITSGTADPTGRPLALISFLVDARDWPADSTAFLRTNLILHLLNGALLFALLRSLGRWIDGENPRVEAAALLGAGLWLLHPLFVSTTLYAVQRQAMLPATFTVLGLLAYVHGRSLYARAQRAKGSAWMIAGVVGGTAFALLCKGNGVLVPLLAWVLEFCVLQFHNGPQSPSDRRLRRFRWALLGLPSLVVIGYLLSFLPGIGSPIEARGWSIGQRLLTEPRILVDYLQLLVVPRSVSTGLYNDAYQVSTSLFRPWSTFPAALLVLLLPLLAWRYRKVFPGVSAALLFFFVGHLLESSVVPLELYFEHRNYLPAMLLFWPLARAICAWQVPTRTRGAIALALIMLLGITTFQRTTLWGNPHQLAALWAKQNPESSRAQATVAMMDTSAGEPEEALARLGPLWKQRPYDPQIALNYVNAACVTRGLNAADSRALTRTLEHANAGISLISGWLESSMELAGTGECPGLGLAEVEAWLQAFSRNRWVLEGGASGQNTEPLRAQLAMRKRLPETALLHFNRALAAFATPDVAARNAAMLASNGFYGQALSHLDYYEQLKATGHLQPPGRGMPQLHAKVLQWQNYWPNEMRILRIKLQGEIATRRAVVTEPSSK